MILSYDGIKAFLKATVITALLALPAPATAQSERQENAKIRIANPGNAPTEPTAPNTLVNTMVSGCDSGWKRRRDSKLCIDLEDKDSFKPGEPISFKVTTGKIPEGKVLFVSLSRLSIVSLPYSTEPVEGYSGGIPLLPTPAIQSNSSFSYTWDGTNTHCYWTDTGSRCNLAANLATGRYVLVAQLRDEVPAFGDHVDYAKKVKLPEGEKPVIPIASVTRAFSIDAPLDWSQYIRTADQVARDYAYGQLAVPEGLYVDFKESIELTPQNESFEQEKNNRWCRNYKVSGVAKGSVKACLPPYTVSEYGLWQTRHDPRKFVSSGTVSYANDVPDLLGAVQASAKLLSQLYDPVLQQPKGVLNRSGRLERTSYSAEKGAWFFVYDVQLDFRHSLKQDLGLTNTLQTDAAGILVSKNGKACLAWVKHARSQYRAATYVISADNIMKAKCPT